MVQFLLTEGPNSEYMGLATNKHAAALDGTTNGIFIAGCCTNGASSSSNGPFTDLDFTVIGSIVSTFLPEVFGRRMAVFLGAILATIGGALQAGSVNMAMFIVFRLVAGLGVGMT